MCLGRAPCACSAAKVMQDISAIQRGYTTCRYGQMHYRQAGPQQGGARTLVLLHQNPSSSYEYEALITAMAADRRVIAFDTPGYGMSDPPQEPPGMAGSLPLAALLVASADAVFSVTGIIMFATLQTIVPPRMRGSAISLTLVLNTLIGATLGPLAIASLTQRVLGDPAQVGWSIALVAVPCLAAGIALFLLARRNMLRAVAAGGETARLLTGG
jgi:pimeloyl-ACP methyl ester carboxylesterase